jgi:hypothetical protein
MDLKEIMSVSGQSGLFRFVSQGRNGIIVESFSDKKRSFISANNKVSSLEDIAIFTDEKEVPLEEVFKKIYDLEQGKPAPDPKSSSDVLKNYLEKLLPNYDRERVYVSDIKKLISWYNILLSLNMFNFEEEQTPESSSQSVEPVTSEPQSVSSGPKEEKPVTSIKKTSKVKKEKR